MAWEDFTDSVRHMAQTETTTRSRAGAIGTMIVLTVTVGVLAAAMIIPGTSFLAATASDVADDALELPMALDDQPNPQTTRLLASDGSLLAYFYEENRQDVPLDQINETMQESIIAIEDNRFYDHGALDLQGTLRALVNNASGDATQGGSSITQQLVKLTLVQQATTREQMRAATEVSTARKVRELKLAIQYEEDHTKEEILERYLNIAYFGDGAYGVNAAAFHYFSVAPEDLTVSQAATLAGLVKNPDEFNPRVYPERALQRRNTVLQVMANQGKITQDEADERIASDLGLEITQFPNGCVSSVAAFSCDYIRQYLLDEEALGTTVGDRQNRLERGGLTIKSNIDVRMQEAINGAVENRVAPTDRAVGSLALVEPGTGNVRGIAQSRPMGTDQGAGETFLNYSVPTEYGQSGGFQAGSTFKFFTAVAALKEGINSSKAYSSPQEMTIPSGTFFDCEGRETDEWEVGNSTGSGTFNMVGGLRRSVNTYFAQLERDAGLCNVVKAARDMGIYVPDGSADGQDTNEVPSFTLGVTSVSTLDMAAAYAAAASGGEYCAPRPVNEILDSAGEVVKRYDTSCKRVMSENEAATMNSILRGLQQPGGFGHSNGTALNIDSAAKTGTTNSSQAVWYVGYTPELAAASMIAGANDDGRPRSLVGVTLRDQPINFNQAGGSSLAGPMWKDAMGTIQEYLSPERFEDPNQSVNTYRAPAPPSNNDEGDDSGDDGDNDRGGDDGDNDRGGDAGRAGNDD